MTKYNLLSYLCTAPYTKTSFKGMKDLNMKVEALKLLKKA